MKEFLQVLRRFVTPYKKYVALSIVFNILSALLNIFSFAALIPILQILFKTDDHVQVTALMAWEDGSFKDVLINNIYYYINYFIADMGSTTTLLFIGLFLIFATLLKTIAYFLASLFVRVWFATCGTRYIRRLLNSPWAFSQRNAKVILLLE